MTPEETDIFDDTAINQHTLNIAKASVDSNGDVDILFHFLVGALMPYIDPAIFATICVRGVDYVKGKGKTNE
jgi:hypothetical protein